MSSAPPAALAKPAPHRLVHGLLGEEQVEQLLAYVIEQREQFRPTTVGSGQQVKTGMRISTGMRELGPWRSVLDEKFQALLPWALQELKLSPFTLDHLQMEVVAHGDGAFYQRHVDTMADAGDPRSRRMLSAVYYFHRMPQRFSGGALRLFGFIPDPESRNALDIAPQRDMALFFPAWAPHEVRPITLASTDFGDCRFAINCWYVRA